MKLAPQLKSHNMTRQEGYIFPFKRRRQWVPENLKTLLRIVTPDVYHFKLYPLPPRLALQETFLGVVQTISTWNGPVQQGTGTQLCFLHPSIKNCTFPHGARNWKVRASVLHPSKASSMSKAEYLLLLLLQDLNWMLFCLFVFVFV